MSKAISMTLYPQDARPVSRAGKDDAVMVAIVRTDGMNGRGDEKIGEPGQIRVRCTVNRWGLVSVEASEAASASTDRDLFYAQVVLDGSHPSGVRVRRETYPPARPDGAVNLTAEQAEAIRAALALLDPWGIPGTGNVEIANAARAALGMGEA